MAAIDAASLIEPRDQGRRAVARDIDAFPGALELGHLERMLEDIQNQPGWRAEADKAVDYYDGNQLTPEVIAKLAERGLGPLNQNLIKPTIDAVLGLEAKTRTDWMVTCDDDRYHDVVDATNAKLKEAERETRADRACSDAYAGEIKAGFHCVEVSRSTDPFAYPYRVMPVHRREIYWDWMSQHPNWDDARYVVRRRWLDTDVVAAYFPQHAELIKYAGNGWAGNWSSAFSFDDRVFKLLASGQETENRTRIEDLEWRNTERNRVCVFEVWYRTYHRGAVIELPNGKKLEYNPKNQVHVAAVASGKIMPRIGVFSRLRLAYFVGPHRVMDQQTTRRRFPYIPFWGYREDLTGAPYGLIRSMLSPQDEVNARRAKMMWLLSAKRVIIDADALDPQYNTLTAASRELARADAFLIANPNRVNSREGIRVDENMELAEQQFKLLQEAKTSLQEAGGIYAAMMGQNSNATSGAAIQSLIEQGTMTLAEINDNYFFSRREVGNALVELIQEDMEGQMLDIMVESGSHKRRVTVNKPARDEETGMEYLENDTSKAKLKVSLTDVPSTPSFRAQQFTQLAEITKSLPPQLQAFVAPFIIEASELSKRRELATILRKQLGIDVDPNTPEGQQQAQAVAQQQAAAAELAMKDAMAKIAETEAKTQKSLAEAEKIRAEIGGGDPQAGQQMAAAAKKLQDEVTALQLQVVQLKAEQAGSAAEAQIQAEAEVEKARATAAGQERVAQIEREAEIEIANINANAEKKIDALLAKIDDLQRKFDEKIKAVQQDAADRDAKAREDAAKKDADKAKAESKERSKKDDKPAQPMVVVVPQGGGKKSRKIKFQTDASGALVGAEVEDDD